MLIVIAIVLVFAGLALLFFGGITNFLALSGSEGLTERKSGKILSATPCVVPDAQGGSHMWMSYRLSIDNGDGEGTEVTTWAPEWYVAMGVGDEVTLICAPGNPGECMIADVHDAMRQAIPACVKGSIALVALGAICAIVAAVIRW